MKKLLLGFLALFLTVSLACGSGFLMAIYLGPQTDLSDEEKTQGSYEGEWKDYASSSLTSKNGFVQIGSATELAQFANLVNDGTYRSSNAELTADIDLSAHYWNPIGSYTYYNLLQGVHDYSYSGTFNGNGYSITGISTMRTEVYLNDIEGSHNFTEGDVSGLFAITRGATIKNLTISSSVSFSGSYDGDQSASYYGGLVGLALNTTIQNVTVKNQVIYWGRSGKNVGTAEVLLGGIAGAMVGGTISDSINEASVTVDTTEMNDKKNTAEYYVGGLVGRASEQANIFRCINEGVVSFKSPTSLSYSGYYVDAITMGGLVGRLNGNVSSCINKGEVKKSGQHDIQSTLYNSAIAGIVGSTSQEIDSNTSTISKCHNFGDITISQINEVAVGGVCGVNRAYGTKIEQCSNFAKMSLTMSGTDYRYYGGILGGSPNKIHSVTIVDCANYGEIEIGGTSSSKVKWIGGITGWIYDNGNVEFCFNHGHIDIDIESHCVGGIIGEAGSTDYTTTWNIIDGTTYHYDYVNVSLVACYNLSKFALTNATNVGQIAGWLNTPYTSWQNYNLTNCNSVTGNGYYRVGKYFVKGKEYSASNGGNSHIDYSLALSYLNLDLNSSTVYDADISTSTTWYSSYLVYDYYAGYPISDRTNMNISSTAYKIPILMSLVAEGRIVVKLKSCFEDGSTYKLYTSASDSLYKSDKTIDYMGNIGHLKKQHESGISTSYDFRYIIGVDYSSYLHTSPLEVVCNNRNVLTFTAYYGDYDSVNATNSAFQYGTGGLNLAQSYPKIEYSTINGKTNKLKTFYTAVFTESGRTSISMEYYLKEKESTITVSDSDGWYMVEQLGNDEIISDTKVAKFFINKKYALKVSPKVGYRFVGWTGYSDAQKTSSVISVNNLVQNNSEQPSQHGYMLGDYSYIFTYDSAFILARLNFDYVEYEIKVASGGWTSSDSVYSAKKITDTDTLTVGSDSQKWYDISEGYLYTLSLINVAQSEGKTYQYATPIELKKTYDIEFTCKLQDLFTQLVDLPNSLATVDGNIAKNTIDVITIKVEKSTFDAKISTINMVNSYTNSSSYSETSTLGGSVVISDFSANKDGVQMNLDSGDHFYTYEEMFGYEIESNYALVLKNEEYLANISNSEKLGNLSNFENSYGSYSLNFKDDILGKYKNFKGFNYNTSTAGQINLFYDKLYGTNVSGQNSSETQDVINIYSYFSLKRYDFGGEIYLNNQKLAVAVSGLTVIVKANENQADQAKTFAEDKIYYNAPVTISVTVPNSIAFNGISGGSYVKTGAKPSNSLSLNLTYTFTLVCDTTVNTKENDAVYIRVDFLSYDTQQEVEPTQTAGVYKIESAENLVWLERQVVSGADFSNATFKQTTNIDLSNTNLKPIGTSGNAFNGTYDGGNYIISGLGMTNSYGEFTSHNALFAYTDGATIRNVNLKDVSIKGYSYIASLVAYAKNTTFERITVTNCDISAENVKIYDIYGVEKSQNAELNRNYFGGLVAFANSCSFRICSVEANVVKDAYNIVDGDNVPYVDVFAGFVGMLSGTSNVQECAFDGGVVSGADSIDSFANKTGSATIRNSYAYLRHESSPGYALYELSCKNGQTLTGVYATIDEVANRLDPDIFFVSGGKLYLKSLYWA